jgi:hypothetical protein
MKECAVPAAQEERSMRSFVLMTSAAAALIAGYALWEPAQAG